MSITGSSHVEHAVHGIHIADLPVLLFCTFICPLFLFFVIMVADGWVTGIGAQGAGAGALWHAETCCRASVGAGAATKPTTNHHARQAGSCGPHTHGQSEGSRALDGTAPHCLLGITGCLPDPPSSPWACSTSISAAATLPQPLGYRSADHRIWSSCFQLASWLLCLQSWYQGERRQAGGGPGGTVTRLCYGALGLRRWGLLCVKTLGVAAGGGDLQMNQLCVSIYEHTGVPTDVGLLFWFKCV